MDLGQLLHGDPVATRSVVLRKSLVDISADKSPRFSSPRGLSETEARERLSLSRDSPIDQRIDAPLVVEGVDGSVNGSVEIGGW